MAAAAVAPHFFPNVILKQLRFKTLVVQFPRKAYKILYFYLKPPTRNSASPFLINIVLCKIIMVKSEYTNSYLSYVISQFHIIFPVQI